MLSRSAHSRNPGWGPRRHRVRTYRALDRPGLAAAAGRARPEVAKDFLDHARVDNNGDNAHRASADGTARVAFLAFVRVAWPFVGNGFY